MSCEIGGFITLQHSKIRDITAKLLSEVCKDLWVQPCLLKLNGGEETMRGAATKNNKVRIHVGTRGFGWIAIHFLI